MPGTTLCAEAEPIRDRSWVTVYGGQILTSGPANDQLQLEWA